MTLAEHSTQVQGLLASRLPAGMAHELCEIFDAGFDEGQGEAEVSACPYPINSLGWYLWSLGSEMGATA